MASEMTALAARVEAEPAGGKLWLDACASLKLGGETFERFAIYIAQGAYLDAADMLRPVNGRMQVAFVLNEAGTDEVTIVDLIQTVSWGYLAHGRASGPHAEARARLAAALRARDAGGA